jgi:hypothetical protein
MNFDEKRSEPRPKRLLLIDDDPLVSDILLLRIAQSCPLVDASAITSPWPRPDMTSM